MLEFVYLRKTLRFKCAEQTFGRRMSLLDTLASLELGSLGNSFKLLAIVAKGTEEV